MKSTESNESSNASPMGTNDATGPQETTSGKSWSFESARRLPNVQESRRVVIVPKIGRIRCLAGTATIEDDHNRPLLNHRFHYECGTIAAGFGVSSISRAFAVEQNETRTVRTSGLT